MRPVRWREWENSWIVMSSPRYLDTITLSTSVSHLSFASQSTFSSAEEPRGTLGRAGVAEAPGDLRVAPSPRARSFQNPGSRKECSGRWVVSSLGYLGYRGPHLPKVGSTL